MLYSSFIKFSEEDEDILLWSKNMIIGIFTTKLGYKMQVEVSATRDKVQWWECVWKLHSLLKAEILLWLDICNKLLKWANDLK